MSTENVEVRVGATDQASGIFSQVAAGLQNFSGHVALMAGKFAAIQYAAQQAFNAIQSVVSPAIEAVRQFDEGIVKTAALITSFQGNKGDVAGNYQQAKLYAEGLWQAMEKVDANTMASASDLAIITEEMLKQRVVLDINNQKQLDAFANIANAAAVIAMGYPGQEIQLRQEIRALMEGQVNQNSQLASQLQAMISGPLKDQVTQHKKAGDLVEWLGERLSGYAAASGDIGGLWSTITSTMSTLVNQVLRGGFGPAFKEIVGQATALGEWAKQHKEDLMQLVNRGWLVIKGVMESVIKLFGPLLESTSAFREWIDAAFRGLGYIAYAVLPPLSERVGEIAAGMMEWIKLAFNLGDLLWKAFSFDWEGVKAAWDNIQQNFAQSGVHAGKAFREGFFREIGERAADFDQKFGTGTTGRIKTPDLGPAPSDEGKKAKSRVPDWKSELEQMLEAEDNYFRNSKDKELAFWEQKLSLTKKGSAERRAVEHEIFSVKRDMAKEELAVDLQKLKDQSDAARSGSLERIDIARQEAELINSKYGEQSKEYAAALRQIDQMHREFLSDMNQREAAAIEGRKDLALIRIEQEQESISFRREMGEISAQQELQLLGGLEARRLQIETDALKERLKLQRQGTLEYEQTLRDIEKAQAQSINRQSQLSYRAALEQKKTWETAFDSISGLFDKGVQAMMNGTLTFRNVMRAVALQMLGDWTNMLRRKVAQWITTEMTLTTVKMTEEQKRLLIEQTGHQQSILMTLWAAIKKIATFAAQAAAGAYQAVVSIPYVGPILAPIAAGVAFAGVMAFGALASAAGGWDYVDRDQMAMVHQREMILPAELADRVRGMTDPGLSGGGGGAIALTINAIDAKSVRRLFADNGPALTASLRKQVRNFNSGGKW